MGRRSEPDHPVHSAVGRLHRRSCSPDCQRKPHSLNSLDRPQLTLLLKDVEAFARMAGAGQFTGGTFDLSGLTDSINLLLGTMMTSISAVATDYIITRTAGQSIAEIQSTTDLYWDTGCGGGYDSQGICGAFYYDGKPSSFLNSARRRRPTCSRRSPSSQAPTPTAS